MSMNNATDGGYLPEPSAVRSFGPILIILLLIDFLLIGSYLAFRGLEFFDIANTPEPLKFEGPGTLPSYWLYAKLLATALAFAWLSRLVPARGFLPIGLFFLVLFLYDYFVEYPEDLEEIPAPFLGEISIFGLRAINLDEIAQITVLLGLAVWSFWYALQRTDGSHNRFLKQMIWLVVLLAVFGVGVDLVHLLIDGVESKIGLVIQTLIGLAEDGGEMVVGSLIVAAALTHALRTRKDRLA